jgi:hypothetical protein
MPCMNTADALDKLTAVGQPGATVIRVGPCSCTEFPLAVEVIVNGTSTVTAGVHTMDEAKAFQTEVAKKVGAQPTLKKVKLVPCPPPN